MAYQKSIGAFTDTALEQKSIGAFAYVAAGSGGGTTNMPSGMMGGVGRMGAMGRVLSLFVALLLI